MELSLNLYEGYDQQSTLEQEMSSTQSPPEMLASSRSEYSFEDTFKTEESLTWPAAMGLAPPTTSTTATVTSVATASFPATVKRPLFDDLPGPFDFKIEPSRHQEDAHWVYSQILGKVFTDVGKSVRFNVTLTDWTSTVLFVRALPVFSPESDSFEEVVSTCPHHEDKSHTINTDFPAVKHVVRCSNPLTQYQTDPVSGRHSVVTPLSAPQPGAISVPLLYTFVCKNSCKLGIGGRVVILLFSLENHSGEILGRRRLEVRVCSCPRRDKVKQEQKYLRSHSRDQTEDVQSETKAVIQQLVRTQPLQEVPQSQECNNIALRACSNTQGQQADFSCIDLPVLLTHQREIAQQAIALMWRDAGENQVPLSECDSLLMQMYKGS